jgi:hypothetical protein
VPPNGAMRLRRPNTLASWNAAQGIDAVEPVPPTAAIPSADAPGLAAVATYALGEDRLRSGCVHLVRANRGPDWSLKSVATAGGLPGVLDLRCVVLGDDSAPSGEAVLIVAACADASIRAFAVGVADANRSVAGEGGEGGEGGDDARLTLSLQWAWTCAEPSRGASTIALAIDIAPAPDGQPPPCSAVAVATDSLGSLHVVEFTTSACACRRVFLDAHADSVWAGTLAAPVGADAAAAISGTLYSGGDDAALAAWDAREAGVNPIFRLRTPHAAVGVTSLHVLRGRGQGAGSGHGLLSGGYDDVMRLWDVRSMRRPVSKVACGGGVWRIKEDSDPSDCRRFLLGCMYDGFKVIELGAGDEFTITASYREHGSLAYGTAWMPLSARHGGDGGEAIGASCDGGGSWALGVEGGSALAGRVALTGSFCDRSLHLWAA